MRYFISDKYFKPNRPSGWACGCEYGHDCSRMTVCTGEHWIEETKDEFKSLLYAIEEVCQDEADGAPDAGPAAVLANQILAILEYGPKGTP